MSEGRILDKIRKLLSVGNDERGNQTERETALRQAYALLAKHNLDIAQVGSAQDQEKREEQNTQLSVYPWARGIAHSLAGLFFCSYYFQRPTSGKLATHSFVGRASNAITAREMTEYVVRSVFKELRTRYGSETSPEARSFAVGVETMIRSRCQELRQAAEQASQRAAQAAQHAAQEAAAANALEGAVALAGPAPAPQTGTALVLAGLYTTERKANDEWIAQNVGKLHTQADRTKDVGSRAAYAAGKEHGSKINLSRQLGGKSSAKALR